MANYSAYQTFQSDWAKTVMWAQQNHIAPNSYMPVYNMDAQRLVQNGYPMSQGDRIRAVQAAAGQPVTQLPSDNPSPTSIYGNVVHNAESLFSGLNPFHLIPQLWDMGSEAFHHPIQELVHPAADLLSGNFKGFGNDVLNDPHSIWSLVPGAYDLAQLTRGKAGLRQLADNPLTAILDVVPVGKLAMAGLAATELGETAARAAGVSAKDLSKMSPSKAVFKMSMNIPTKTQKLSRTVTGVDEATGKPIVESQWRNQTTGDLVRRWLNHKEAGPEQAELIRGASLAAETATDRANDIVKEQIQPLADLPHDERIHVMQQLSKYHVPGGFEGTRSEFLASDLFQSAEQAHAAEKFLDFRDDTREYRLNLPEGEEGRLVMVETMLEDGKISKEAYLANSDRPATIRAAQDQYQAAMDAFHEGAEKFNELLSTSEDMDRVIHSYIPQVQLQVINIRTAIQSSLPDLLDSPNAERLRNALPVKQRFDRSGYLKSRNLEALFGLDETTEERVSRGGANQVAPFTGEWKDWSPTEQEAWYGARRMLERSSDFDPKKNASAFRTLVKRNATDRMRLLGQLQKVRVHSPISPKAVTALADLIQPAGLFDQMFEAFHAQRWDDLLTLSQQAWRKLQAKSFNDPNRSDVLKNLQTATWGIKEYARKRRTFTNQLEQMWSGKNLKGKTTARVSPIDRLVRDADKATKRFKDTSLKNPPAVWDNYKTEEYDRLLATHTSNAERNTEAIQNLRDAGVPEKALAYAGNNPAILEELGRLYANSTFMNEMIPNADPVEAARISRELDENIAGYRARGMEPLYIRTLHPWDQAPPSVSIAKDRISREQASFDKKQGQSTTYYDHEAAAKIEIAERMKREEELNYQEKYMRPQLHELGDLLQIAQHRFGEGWEEAKQMGNLEFWFESLLENEFNLQKFEPEKIFSISHPTFSKGTYYIDRDLAKALTDKWAGAGPLTGFYDEATKLFRFSVLGYSPRFTAHVVVGGGVMWAARQHLSAFKPDRIRNGWKITVSHELPDEITENLKEDPHYLIRQVHHRMAVQEGGIGSAESVLARAGGHSAGQFAIQEKIARLFGKDAADLKHPDWFTHYLKVIPELNRSITSFATHLYSSISFLDGFERAMKNQHFYTEVWDAKSRRYTQVRQDMSPDQAFRMATREVDKVMGDVLNMTPIERNVLTRAFPFWSWAKHVLQYVATYPGDHPIRATFISQLSRISLADQNQALPARTQLLFFLGGPDAMGNVTAVDTRFADPFRDTGTYLTLSGWLSSLNPVFTTPFSMIDPSITFGQNVLYPNVTYDSIYGTNDAGAPSNNGGTLGTGGTAYSVLENTVPEAQALDVALNLSGQYAYLQKGNHQAFMNKVFSDLGIPFLHTQSVNVKQLAATNELDRYHQALSAATQAFNTGDFSGLAGYESVPDPRPGGSVYNITPAALQATYQQTAAQLTGTGLTPMDVATQMPAPAY